MSTYCSLEEAWGENPYSNDIPAQQMPTVQNMTEIPENNEYKQKPQNLQNSQKPEHEKITKWAEPTPKYHYEPIDAHKSEIQAYNLDDAFNVNYETTEESEDEKELYKAFDYHRKELEKLMKKIERKRKLKSKLKKDYASILGDEKTKEDFTTQNTKTPENILYNFKDIIIMILAGIFFIFILDIFVKIGCKTKDS